MTNCRREGKLRVTTAHVERGGIDEVREDTKFISFPGCEK